MWKLSAAALAGLAVGLAGCGDSGASAKVTGTVRYNGQPVKAGVLYFKSDQLGEYNTNLREDGSYAFNGLPPGAFTVVVDNETWNPEQKSPDYKKVAGKMGAKAAKGYDKMFSEYDKVVGGGAKATGGGEEATTELEKEKKEALARIYVKLPKKYSHPKTSGLTYTVVGGAQTKDFDLTD